MPSKLFQPGLLDGQAAIVSGGGSGLGRASALELAALGAQVVVCGRREEPLEETAARADGGRVEARVCDIREEEQVDAVVTLEHGVDERVHLVLLADVARMRLDLALVRAGGRLGERLLAPPADHDARAERRQLERARPAEPRAAPAHDRQLAVEQAGLEDPRGHPGASVTPVVAQRSSPLVKRR